MATKPQGGLPASVTKAKPVYGQTTEEDDDVDAAMRRVMDAYTARQNRGYDPGLMAIAQGLLSSKGNFGEAAGMAAKNYQDVQGQLRQEDLETAQAGLQLTQAKRDQALVRRRMAGTDEMLSGSGAIKNAPVDPDAPVDPNALSQPASGKPNKITPQAIAAHIRKFGPTPESDAAIRLLQIEDARYKIVDGVLYHTGDLTATRLTPIGLPESGLDPKDTTTIAGTFPMDSRDRLLYSKIASIGGEEIAAKFMDDYQQRGGVAPDWAVRFYNTELTRKEPPPEQLVTALRDLAGKTNALKNASPDDVKNFRPTAIQTRILTALSRITAAQGNVENLNAFEQQVLAAAQGLMKKDVPAPAAPVAAAAPAPEVKSAPPVAAAPAVKAAAPAPAAPAPAAPAPAAPAAAPAAAAPAADALPPKPVLKAYPAPPTGVVSTQQKAAYDNSVKAIEEENKAIMKDYELRYGTAAANAARPLELEQEKKRALQAAEVASQIEGKKDFIQRRKDADDTITIANIFRRFAEDPKAKDMTGILNNDKISSGIATLIKDGIGAGDFRIGVPEIENVMRNAGLNAAQQAKFRTFLMYTAQMQLQQTKYMKGAVSNYEQQLMGSAGINAQDTPATIRMKADLLIRRAQFDRRAAKAFKNSKMTSEDFIDSDEYNQMRDKYNEDLADLASGSKVLVTPPKAAEVSPSPGFIRDPITKVMRKKRPGE
jgi:hypothetical protein